MDSKIDLKNFRKKYKLDRDQLAYILGVSKRTIEAWEVERFIPSKKIINLMYQLENLSELTIKKGI